MVYLSLAFSVRGAVTPRERQTFKRSESFPASFTVDLPAAADASMRSTVNFSKILAGIGYLMLSS